MLRDDLGRLRAGEPVEADLLGDSLGHQPGTPLPEHRSLQRLARPIRGNDQQGQSSGLAGELGERLQAQVVRPLKVLEDERRRPFRASDEIDELHDEVATARASFVQSRSGNLEQVPPDRSERSVAAHGPAQVEERGGEDIMVLGRDLGLRDAEAILGRDPADLGEEPRLADPGLAGEEQQLAVAAADFSDASPREGDVLIARHDDRRQQRSDVRHAAECRRGPSVPPSVE